MVQNFGQIGLTEIGLFTDSQAITPLCWKNGLVPNENFQG